MSDGHNPLIPTAYDFAWSVVTVVVIALTVVALLSVARSAKRVTPWQRVAWVALILLVPVFGPMSWLVVGNRRHVAVPGGPRRS